MRTGRGATRLPTALVVAALAAIALLAALDALRSAPREEERPAREPVRATGPQIENRAALARALREAGASGVLSLADGRCELWRLHLPRLLLEPVDTPRTFACRFRQAPDRAADGSRLTLAELAPARGPFDGAHALASSPDGRWAAIATDANVSIVPVRGPGPVVRVPLAARDLVWRSR